MWSADCWRCERLREGERGVTEDEMVGWRHPPNGAVFEQTPEDSEGQRSLVCSSSWGRKELDTTEWLNNNKSSIFKEDSHSPHFLSPSSTLEDPPSDSDIQFFISSGCVQKPMTHWCRWNWGYALRGICEYYKKEREQCGRKPASLLSSFPSLSGIFLPWLLLWKLLSFCGCLPATDGSTGNGGIIKEESRPLHSLPGGLASPRRLLLLQVLLCNLFACVVLLEPKTSLLIQGHKLYRSTKSWDSKCLCRKTLCGKLLIVYEA